MGETHERFAATGSATIHANSAISPLIAKHAKRLALETWMQSQNDSRKIFNKPRPLSDPASTKPAALDEAQK
jgi:hypothetical protein